MVVALLAVHPAPAANTSSLAQKRQTAQEPFERAQKLREALGGLAASARSRRDYQRVIEAYRRVYHTDPTSPKAAPSVAAVANLLAEKGRAFGEEKPLRDAIGQYEFLRREYPGSGLGVEALFTIAEIQRQDLEETGEAKSTFQQFLKLYPRHRLAAEARAAIRDLEAAAAKRDSGKEPDDAQTARSLPLITGVRHWSTPDYTRIAIDLEQRVKYEAGRLGGPDRIFFDLHSAKLTPELVGKTFEVEDGFLRKIRASQYRGGVSRIVLEVRSLSEYSAFLLTNPDRLIIDVHGRQTAAAPGEKQAAATKPGLKRITDQDDVEMEHALARKGERPAKTSAKSAELEIAKLEPPAAKATEKPTTKPTFESVGPRPGRNEKSKQPGKKIARAARPASNGERSLIRALGLKIGRIVVDAGHGGPDAGTIGPTGLQEKDLVLDVTQRLGRLIENRLGAEVVYTREDDVFVPLETRTALANKHQADLFISIHANGSEDPEARGVETYYLNFTSSPEALEVAARENAASEKSVSELQNLVKKIALKEKIEESREFAGEVQQALWSVAGKGTRPRGVKKAPFIVLIGANMPSVLAEISFLSNPADERKLKTAKYRQKIAEALYRGIAKYASGLGGLKMATRIPEDAGQ